MLQSSVHPPADPAARLLAAAGPVFAQKGFDRAPVREIARVAGVNVAAVSYYYGDKMGLYRAVVASIRDQRQREFPAPVVGQAPPDKTLRRIIRTLLSRMLSADEQGWEAMLLMREMQQPTAVLGELIREYFQPIYDALCQTIEELIDPITNPVDSKVAGSDPQGPSQDWQNEALVAQLALGVVGQCLYYRIGRPVYEQLIPVEMRTQHYTPESLCQHITASTLAACGRSDIVAVRSGFETEAVELKSNAAPPVLPTTPLPSRPSSIDRHTDVCNPREK